MMRWMPNHPKSSFEANAFHILFIRLLFGRKRFGNGNIYIYIHADTHTQAHQKLNEFQPTAKIMIRSVSGKGNEKDKSIRTGARTRVRRNEIYKSGG